MAIFHASVKSFSRGRGHSATAAAAYRGALKLDDARTGLCHDYRRRGGVISVDLVVPTGSPEWCRDPNQLWNASEVAETRSNARVAREVEISLPAELNAHERRALAIDLGQMLVERYAVAAMVAIHAPDAAGDARNHHVHILLTARELGAQGFGSRAMLMFDAREGAGPAAVRNLREAVAGQVNEHLARARRVERVDHRTLEEQANAAASIDDVSTALRLTREPTEHEGKAATAMRRRGAHSDRVARNSMISMANERELPGDSNTAVEPDGTNGLPGWPPSPRRRVCVEKETAVQATSLKVQAERARSQSTNAGAKDSASALAGFSIELRTLVLDFIRCRRLSESDAAAVVEYVRSSRYFEALMRRDAELRIKSRKAQARPARRRRAYAMAQVATTVELRALEKIEEAAPSRWALLKRYSWAVRKRAQVEALAEAEKSERAAGHRTTARALDRYAELVAEALDDIASIESEREQLFPFPSDLAATAARSLEMERAAMRTLNDTKAIDSDALSLECGENSSSYVRDTRRRRRFP